MIIDRDEKLAVQPDATLVESSLNFKLPADSEASRPPEMRGLARDQVRLMVSHVSEDRIQHATFRALPRYLRPGDLLVINTSGTLPAALPAVSSNGTHLRLHLSTRLQANVWSVELRRLDNKGSGPDTTVTPGDRLDLPGGGGVNIQGAYPTGRRPGRSRLWLAELSLPLPLGEYLAAFGAPIRYEYVEGRYPLSMYQTVYATEQGSAEMPSAGRGFTPQLITRLVAEGIQIAPLILHTGVASLEAYEPPYPEFYRVPAPTAALVNMTRRSGRKVVAVGTTVVRALETVAQMDGRVYPGEGWTDLILTSRRRVRAVDGLLTGLHEPKATHLAMLAAFAGRAHIQKAYLQALAGAYLWHEFGDLHLILP